MPHNAQLDVIFPQWESEISKGDSYISYAHDLITCFDDLGYNKALEIGFENGVSAIAILYCGSGATLTSVDIRPNVKGVEFIKNSPFASLHTFANTWSREFWLNNNSTYDLIYIDGDHSFGECSRDIYEAWDVLDGGGTLVIDDTTHPANITGGYGCAIAALQFIEAKQKDIHEIYMCGRLLVIRKHNDFK